MRHLRPLCMLMAILVLSFAVNAQSNNATNQVVAVRKGVVTIPQTEVGSQVGLAVQDSRYFEVQKIIQNQKLHFDPDHALGVVFPGDGKTFFIPVLNETGKKSGFLSVNGRAWALSLEIKSDDKTILDGFSIKTDQNGGVVMERATKTTSSAPSCSTARSPKVTAETLVVQSSEVTSCSYVSSTGFSIGCFALPDNPLGAYYVQTYRYGTTPDLMNPSWWACYQGHIHVCPRYENPGSPYNFPTCGYAPNHPTG